MIRVAIADDHHAVRQGIRALLEKSEDVEVVGEAGDGQEAVALVKRVLPDILVIDIETPNLNGVEAVAHLRELGDKPRALILSMHADATLVLQALRNGAKGYVLKRAISDELLLAVRAVSRGDTFLSPEVAGPIVSPLVERAPKSTDSGERLARLTSREREVLRLIAEGRTNRKIAAHLHLSEKTIEKHRGRLMAKLKIHDTAGLVRFAVKHGFTRLDT